MRFNSKTARFSIAFVVLSFLGISTFGDLLQKKSDDPLILVGKIKYYQKDLDYFARLAKERAALFYKAEKNDNLDLNQIVDFMVEDAVLSQEARRLGFIVSDVTLQKEISTVPAFQKEGRFNKEVFIEIAKSNQMTDTEFLENIRSQISKRYLMQWLQIGSLNGSLVAPQLVDGLLKSLYSQRKIKVYSISEDVLQDDLLTETMQSNPSIELLQRFFHEHQSQFIKNEQHQVSYFIVNQSLLPPLQISDEELQQEYIKRKDDFFQPEVRKVEQLVFETVEEAQKAITTPEIFRCSKSVSCSGFKIVLANTISLQKGISPEVFQGLFDNKIGALVGPIQTKIGWSIFKLVDIIPSHFESFEKVAEQLAVSVSKTKSASKITDLYREAQQKINSLSIQELAQVFHSPLVETDINNQIDEVSKVITNNKNVKTLEIAPLEMGKSFIVFLTNDIKPSYLPKFEDIIEDIRAAWMASRRKILYTEISNVFREYIFAGSLNENIPMSIGSEADVKQLAQKHMKIVEKTISYNSDEPELAEILELGFRSEQAGHPPLSQLKLNPNNSFSFIELISIDPISSTELRNYNPSKVMAQYRKLVVEEYVAALKKRYQIKIDAVQLQELVKG